MNQRIFSRVEVRHRANVICEGETFVVRLENIGLGGFFLRGLPPLDVGSLCQLEIQLQSEQPPITLRATGRVCRSVDDGIAVEIERIGFQDLRLLRQMVAYNFGDGDQIAEEELSPAGSQRLRSLLTLLLI